jgi:hypothetical protein
MRQALEEKRNASRVLVGNPEAKISLGRPRRERQDNINIGLEGKGTAWPGFTWLRTETSGGMLQTR